MDVVVARLAGCFHFEPSIDRLEFAAGTDVVVVGAEFERFVVGVVVAEHFAALHFVACLPLPKKVDRKLENFQISNF